MCVEFEAQPNVLKPWSMDIDGYSWYPFYNGEFRMLLLSTATCHQIQRAQTARNVQSTQRHNAMRTETRSQSMIQCASKNNAARPFLTWTALKSKDGKDVGDTWWYLCTSPNVLLTMALCQLCICMIHWFMVRSYCSFVQRTHPAINRQDTAKASLNVDSLSDTAVISFHAFYGTLGSHSGSRNRCKYNYQWVLYQ